jgi:predicted nucleic acid-binding Zn ribbon protein
MMEQKSNLQEIFKKIANKIGVYKILTACHVCRKFEEIAPQILGEKSLENCKAMLFREGVLTIGIANSAWAQEVFMAQEELKTLINAELVEGRVKKIRIVTAD